MAVKITCIKKDNGNHENPYVAITSMNWIDEKTQQSGTSNREAVYEFVKEGNEAYVKDSSGNKAILEAKVSPKGTKYVKQSPMMSSQTTC